MLVPNSGGKDRGEGLGGGHVRDTPPGAATAEEQNNLCRPHSMTLGGDFVFQRAFASLLTGHPRRSETGRIFCLGV